MTTKITSTHVDAHVRRQCDLVGMLELGATDAEVAYNYLKYVESRAALYQRKLQNAQDERDRLKAQLRALEAEPAKVGKTKQRLAALEKAVAELQSRGFGEKLIAACEQVNSQRVQEKADPFGPRDADGWYAWNGDDTTRPAGRVCIMFRDGDTAPAIAESVTWGGNTGSAPSDIVKWRPAQ